MKRKKEANGYGGVAQLLRGQKKQSKIPLPTDIKELMDREDGGPLNPGRSFIKSCDKCSKPEAECTCSKKESWRDEHVFHFIEAMQAPTGAAPEGPRVKCVLITVGLGNRSDMNYYGPECVASGAPLFEGVPCFLDHQAQSESQDRPERSVKDKCGYFKNVHTEQVDGRLGLVAELHFDLSETGRLAYEKALTAIHYKAEMPESDREYVGLSITADGDREPRTMQVDDEVLDVKYVTAFTRVGSVDEVTDPARGGRFLAALVESAAGAMMKRKETRMKLVERAKAAQSALKEGLKDKDMSDASKKKLAETDSFLTALLKEAEKAAEEAAGDKGHAQKQMDGEESEEEEESASAGDPHASVKPGHKVTTTKVTKHDGPAGEEEEEEESGDGDGDDDEKDGDAQESKRIAVRSLLKEAGVPKKLWGLDKLVKLSLKEAKAEIEEKVALIESIREASDETEVGFGAPLSESDRGEEKSLNSLFSGCAQ
jgi:hypothetical protein